MDKNEYIDLFHKLQLNEVAFKPLFRCDDEVLALVNAALAQRTWVGLTVHDQNDCLVSADPCECLADPESHQLMDDVEAKLKEKNT